MSISTLIPIVPVQFYPTQATFMQIADVYVNLEAQTANCQYTFLDSGSNAISASAGRWTMNTGIYAGWGASDAYFVGAVISGLGLTVTTG